jgi:hypothetical protein
VSRLGRVGARAAIHFYPASWRRRYAAELQALIDDSDAGIGDVLDVAVGAVHEHAIGGAPMRFEPAHRHPSAFAIVALAIVAPTFAFVTLSIIGHELGVSAVASVVDPVIETVTAPRIVDLMLVLAPLAAFGLAALPLFDARLERGDEGRMLAVRVRALPVNLAVVALAVLLGAALVAHTVAESVLHAGA